MSSEPDAFDSAEFYTCRDPDLLTLESPVEAIEEWLDRVRVPGDDIVALIKRLAPIIVSAYDRQQVSDAWIEGTAESLLYHAAESFAEDFSDPAGSHDDGLGDAEFKSALPAMKAAVKQLVEHGDVWACERVATRDFDADQVTAMMREQCPEWFEKDVGGT